MKHSSLCTTFFVTNDEDQKMLNNALSQFDAVTITKIIHNSSEALEYFNHSKPDLLFIDISLVSYIIHVPKPPFIIGIYDENEDVQLTKLLSVGLFDVVSSPIQKDRLNNIMNKIFNIFYYYNPLQENLPQVEEDQAHYNHQQISESLCNNDYMFINGNKKIGSIKIYFHDILFISSVSNVIRVNLENGVIKYVHTTLKNFQKKLPPNKFLKINRAIVVNIDKVIKVNHKNITVNNETFVVSRPFYKRFAEALQLK